jgi:hypothetical protein
MQAAKLQVTELFGLCCLLLVALPAQAQTEVEGSVAGEAAVKGFDLSARSDRSDRGFSDSKVEMTMTLRNAAGKESSRELLLTTLEVPDESVGDKSLIIFTSPPDIDGTALLSHAHILEADDQWLYLPALRRIKRISSANKSGPFVGSEFSFEDFTAQELNKFSYRYVGEQACGEMRCDVIERKPLYEYSGYARQLAWLDQQVFQVRQVEYYDRRGDLLKTLNMNDYREYSGGVWRTHKMDMLNHKTGKSTELRFGTYVFSNGLQDRDFEKSVLKRIR